MFMDMSSRWTVDGCRDREVMVVKKIGFLFLFLFVAENGRSAEKMRSIQIVVENPSNASRPAADVVVSIPELREVAPDFMSGSLRVICAPSADSKETIELPSQVDDLDGDGKADELAFQINLGPDQARVVTIQYGEPDQIYRLRKDYPERTNALFSKKFEGLGWESENIAFRVYFDPRNSIDIYGKRRRSLQLQMYAVPEYPYHEESPEGRDIFRVGESIGIGAVAAWVDGKVLKAADVKQRTWRIVSLGPVRTIVELVYDGWKIGDKTVTAHSMITMWAGERGFYNTVSIDPEASVTLVSGIPVARDIPIEKFISSARDNTLCLVTWGEQVLAPGATATAMIPGQNLGLAILTTNRKVEFATDQVNYLLRFAPQSGDVIWYAMAAWDQERKSARKSSAAENAITTKEAFLSVVKDQAKRVAEPAKVRVLTGSAAN
jgi:hypothetical protein